MECYICIDFKKIDNNCLGYSKMDFLFLKTLIFTMLLDYLFLLTYSEIYTYICFLMQII